MHDVKVSGDENYPSTRPPSAHGGGNLNEVGGNHGDQTGSAFNRQLAILAVKMKALLLAAGMGTRLRPITDSLPKCMVPIQGRPLLDYWLELLGPSSQCTEILVNTHYLPEPVNEHVRASVHRSKVKLVHEAHLLGTGGTLYRNLPDLCGHNALVAHADNLTLFDFAAFSEAFAMRPSGCLATMMTFETDSPESCGIVELDASGIVQRFFEKAEHPPGRLANGAVYLFSAAALDIIKNFGESAVTDISLDIMPRFLGKMNTWHNTIYHRDIGTPASLAAARVEFPVVYQRFKGNP